MRRVAGFAVVGSIGFIVDAGILSMLTSTGTAGPYAARLVSFPAAVLVTWLLNRTFVFSSRATTAKSKANEWGRYFTVQTVGAGANFLVYMLALVVFPRLHNWPVLALAAGAIAGLLVNYLGSKAWAFGYEGKTNGRHR